MMGLRNENIFDLPTGIACSPPGGMRGLGGGFGSGSPDAGTSMRANERGVKRKDSAIGLAGMASRSPLGFHVVDKETGKGLREFLLQRGKEGGMRKRECRSISFHDFTPELRKGSFRNVLLAHYGVENAGERIDCYEVDL